MTDFRLKYLFDYIRHRQIRILLYHSISDDPLDMGAVSQRNFSDQMNWLKIYSFNVISLDKALEKLLLGDMPKNDVVITFDDGFSDFLENAVPVLSEHQYPATIFVVTDEVGGSSKWESRELQKPLLNWKELVEVSRMGYHIGSHGIHHRRLIQLCDIELEMEVVNSKKKIEDQIGFPVKTFSYPWGEHSIREINAIKKAGYDCAVAVSPRGKLDSLLGNRSDTDPYCLSRVGIRNADSLNSFACKVGVLKECDLEVVKGLFSLAKRPKK